MKNLKELTNKEMGTINGGTLFGAIAGFIVGALTVAADHEAYINKHGTPSHPSMKM